MLQKTPRIALTLLQTTQILEIKGGIPISLLHINKNLLPHSKIIDQTINWIKSVVIECNFCPFAAKALSKKSIHYAVLPSANIDESLSALKKELLYLDNSDTIETTFIIFPNDFSVFTSYLDLVEQAELFLTEKGYDGIYQIASFHPDYCFEGSDVDDAANFTNRSIYPMLHILREASITKALIGFAHPENIPENNIKYARAKGFKYMQMLRAVCMD